MSERDLSIWWSYIINLKFFDVGSWETIVIVRPFQLFNCSSIDNILHIWIHVSPYTGKISVCLFYHEHIWNTRLGKSYKILPSALPLWPVWPLYWPWLAKCNTSISSVTLKASQDLYILSLLLFAPLWYFLHFPCQIIIHWWLSENWTNLDMKFHLIENTMKIPPNFIFLDSKKIPWSMKNEFEFESTIK